MNKKRLGSETQEHLEPQSDTVDGGGYCTSPHSHRRRRLDNTEGPSLEYIWKPKKNCSKY